MKRLVRLSSQRGLLLVEAVLSAVVIATGLVFITRGLASQLRALRTLEEYETLMSLGQNKLLELEGRKLFAHPLTSADQRGTFGDPYRTYQWMLSLGTILTDANGQAFARAIELRVERNDRSSASVFFAIPWPMQWVPDEWR